MYSIVVCKFWNICLRNLILSISLDCTHTLKWPSIVLFLSTTTNCLNITQTHPTIQILKKELITMLRELSFK